MSIGNNRVIEVKSAHEREVERVAPMVEAVRSIPDAIAACEQEIEQLTAGQLEQAAAAILRGDLALTDAVAGVEQIARLRTRIALLKAAAPAAKARLARERSQLTALAMELEEIEGDSPGAPSERQQREERERSSRVTW